MMYNVPLPGNEVWWARFGGGDGGRRDGLIVGSGNWAGEDGAVGELGHVIRIVSLTSDLYSYTLQLASCQAVLEM